MFVTLLAAIGIMSAMTQEANTILDEMKEKEAVQVGCRQFVKGTLEGVPVVFALSGIGKVSAATTASLLIAKFDVEEILFTGVAGGGNGVEIGDVVIGHTYLQHDIDIRPIFPQFYVHSLNKQVLHANAEQVAMMKKAADRFFLQKAAISDLGIQEPKAHEGIIVSGDQFIFGPTHLQTIFDRTKEVLPQGFQAIEMEGAAVAQVCNELNVPFVVLRAISDKANHQAPADCLNFIDQVASRYSLGILREYVRVWNTGE